MKERTKRSIAALTAASALAPLAAVPASAANTANIHIIYRDEEQNKIRDDLDLTASYNDGEEYTVSEELKADFAVKAEGGYNLYRFNEGKSDLSMPYAPEMTVTLVFNNIDQYAYYEDFENGYTVDTSKWHQNAGSAPTAKDDATHYIYHTTGDTTTGGYMTFDEVDTAGSTVRISFDLRIGKPNGQGESQFTIGNTKPYFSSNNINYGVNSTSAGHIIGFVYAAKTGSFTVNGKSLDKGFLDTWMHVEADVDFGSKDVSMKITNDNGLTAEITDAKTMSSVIESNIGSFYMRSGGANGTTSLDNLAIKITGTASDAKPNVESVINFKSVYAFGDSIVYGHNAPQQSFMRLIANDYLTDLNMMAKNGATIMKSSNHILTQVNNAPDKAPDLVVFDGYTNDAYAETLHGHEGVMQGPEATSFDNTTFRGAFEETLYTMKKKWPESEIVFVTIHKSGGRDWDVQNELRDMSLEMCKAWGIHVVDMFTYVNGAGNTLDTREAAQMSKYIINGAGSHPNVAACREFYIPAIVEALEAIVNGDEPEKVTKITAEYDESSRLTSVATEEADKPKTAPEGNTERHKVMYWDSIGGMKPAEF